MSAASEAMYLCLQYRAALRSLLLCFILVLVVSSSSLAQAPSAYDLDFQQLQKEFEAAGNIPAAVVALERAYALRDYVTDTASLDAWFSLLSRRSTLVPGIRREANRYVSMTARHLGDASAKPAARADDLVALAREAVELNPKSASALEALGTIESSANGAIPEALQHLEGAARLAPTTARWLAVAHDCPNQLCRFSALQEAQRFTRKDRVTGGATRAVTVALAEYYAGREQMEKARELLVPLVAAVPSDIVARKLLADMDRSLGRAERARREYEELEKDFPKPIWLKRELAAAYESLGLLDRAAKLAEAAFDENRDGLAEQNLVRRLAEKRRDGSALQRFYMAIAEYDPANSNIDAHLAALSANNGNKVAAERTLRDALARDPRNVSLHQQLSDLLASIGKQDQAEAELAAAVALSPYSDALRYRQQWHSDADTSDPDAPYLASLDELRSADQYRVPGLPAHVTALADIRIDRLQTNGLYSSRVQQFFHVDTAQGARELSSRNVNYAPASESLTILHARVHKNDGRLLEAEDAGESPVADTSVAMYYDVRSRALHFPTLEAGDFVELDYRLTPTSESNPYGDYFGNLFLFRTALPTGMKRYVLVTPVGRQLHIQEVRMSHSATVRQTATERVYQWDAENIAALPNEPRAPAATSFAPYLHISTLANFRELGSWYTELLRPQLELDATLREVATRIARENRDDLARVRAVHQLVLRNTHYVAFEFGVYSYKPYPVSQTYARRFGDCKDKASLMIALLRAVGVQADFALVRTRHMGDIDDNAASLAPFNHAIVYLPKYQLWLDGTAEYAGARELPLEDQGATALTVDADGVAVLRHIPITTADDNYTRRMLRAELHRDGTVEFSGNIYTRGEDAPGLRREYEIPERQRDAVRQPLAEVFPTVRLDKVEVQGAGDLEQDVTVNFRGVLDSFAGKSTVALNSSWAARKYLATLAPLGNRSQDLLLPAPWSTSEEVQFVLPSGAQVTGIPGDINIETPYGSATLTYQVRGRDIAVRNRVQISRLRITPAEYPAFRDFCSQVERAFRQEVKVSLQ